MSGDAESGAPAPAVIWFTGLSGSGKSTIADWVFRDLTAHHVRVERLDGDTVRQQVPHVGFTKADRDAHVRRVGQMASDLERQGAVVVASFISPYRESRDYVRGLCRRFVEVYVATDIGICEQRDVKGLYAKARRGEIPHFTGIDDPYEPPLDPELRIDTNELSVDEAGGRVVAALSPTWRRA